MIGFRDQAGSARPHFFSDSSFLEVNTVVANPLAPNLLDAGVDDNALVSGIWSDNVSRDSTGELRVAGLSVSSLAQDFGTPIFVIDESHARHRAEQVRNAFDTALGSVGAKAKVYYAGKAFLCTEVVRWVAEAGLNVDVASGGELAVALAAGLDPSRIGLHGNNKSLFEIGRAISAGVGAIVIDSELAPCHACISFESSVIPISCLICEDLESWVYV